MTNNSHAAAINRSDYPILVVVAGIAIIVGSFLAGGEFAFFVIMPLSVVIIGIGAALSKKQADAGSNRGLAKYHRPILFVAAMILFSILTFFLIRLFPGN